MVQINDPTNNQNKNKNNSTALLKKNLASIKQHFPHLIELESLQENKQESDIIKEWEVSPSKTGDLTASLNKIAIHSKYNPKRESEQIIAKEFPIGTQCAVFAGWGLGYHIETFLKAFPAACAIVSEPEPLLFLLSLESRDFSHLWETGRVILLLGESTEAVSRAMGDFQGQTFHFLMLRPLLKRFESHYLEIEEIVKKAIFRQQINLNTLKIFGKRWVKNFCANLPLLDRCCGIEDLSGILKNFPSLIVAAGPSLKETLPYIKKLSKRMVILCVDTAIPILLNEGVEPDFAIVVDPQYWNSRHLDRVKTKKTILVTESSVYPSVFRHFSFPSYFYESAFPLIHFVETRMRIHGDLYKGGSVATAAWEVGRYVGCSSVYCAGMDLGFPGGETHFKGGFFEEARHSATTRLNTAEQAGWKYLHDAGIFPVKNMSGGQTLTDKRMNVYISWFNEQTTRYPNFKTYTFSKEGSKIDRATLTSPVEAEKLPECRQKINKIIESITSSSVATTLNGESKKKILLQTVNTLIAEFAKIKEISAKGLILVSQLQRELKTGKSTRKTLSEMDQTDKILMSSGGKEFTAFIFQAILKELNATSSENLTPDEITENSRALYQELYNSAEFHLDRFSRIKFKGSSFAGNPKRLPTQESFSPVP